MLWKRLIVINKFKCYENVQLLWTSLIVMNKFNCFGRVINYLQVQGSFVRPTGPFAFPAFRWCSLATTCSAEAKLRRSNFGAKTWANFSQADPRTPRKSPAPASRRWSEFRKTIWFRRRTGWPAPAAFLLRARAWSFDRWRSSGRRGCAYRTCPLVGRSGWSCCDWRWQLEGFVCWLPCSTKLRSGELRRCPGKRCRPWFFDVDVDCLWPKLFKKKHILCRCLNADASQLRTHKLNSSQFSRFFFERLKISHIGKMKIESVRNVVTLIG